jgi:hypothetical protein
MDRAFFPGGNGLVLGEEADCFPSGGTLVLGSNFGAGEKFCTPSGQLLCRDETNNQGTWTGLRRIFTQRELESSFFTNAWPFLHVGTSNNPTDKEKKRWLKAPVLESCMEFFHYSLETIKPKVIVTLGTAPAAFLGFAFPESLFAWQGNTWKHIDTKPFANVHFRSMTVVCVAITHPSMSNVHSRRPDLRDERSLLRIATGSLPSR